MKRTAIVLALAALALLSGCRVRTTLLPPAPEPQSAAPERIDAPAAQPPEPSEPLPEQPEQQTPEQPADAPAERPDEDAERRVFDEDASGELAPEAEEPLYVPAETPSEAALPAAGEGGEPLNAAAEDAPRTATETVAADEAEQTGADEIGETAESAQAYYLALLDDRVGPLFECKRLYVYWETEEEHRTVGRSSPEHAIILAAGAYNVAVKLPEDDLSVDDGWICRKNPDAVVKVTDGAPQPGSTLFEALSARPGWAETGAVKSGRVLLLSRALLDTPEGRTAAAVCLAKLLYPEQLADVDADEALRALTGDAAGRYAFAA